MKTILFTDHTVLVQSDNNLEKLQNSVAREMAKVSDWLTAKVSDWLTANKLSLNILTANKLSLNILTANKLSLNIS